MSAETQRGWIGVDLDGTLAHYDHWRGPDHIGEPIPAMVGRVKQWLANGWEVRIFTARVSHDLNHVHHAWFLEALKAWLTRAGLPQLQATNVKDFQMVELWDDRAVQVVPNTGVPVGSSTRGLL